MSQSTPAHYNDSDSYSRSQEKKMVWIQNCTERGFNENNVERDKT